MTDKLKVEGQNIFVLSALVKAQMRPFLLWMEITQAIDKKFMLPTQQHA
jgi:hypothetical protein